MLSPDDGAAPHAVPDLHPEVPLAWECWSCPPEAVSSPDALGSRPDQWLPMSVPGTAASALRDLGKWTWGQDDHDLLDGRDWWFRSRFPGPEQSADDHTGAWLLELDGLATITDVWLNGRHLLHSENMWLGHRVQLDQLEPANELVLRCAALQPLLAQKRPRPRWRSLMVRAQALRWYRTTLLGRVSGWGSTGAPIGPWRPIRLTPAPAGVSVRDRHLVARCDGADGVVEVRLVLDGFDPADAGRCEVRVGDQRAPATVVHPGGSTVLPEEGTVVEASIRITGAERWWPHTHGSQARYPVHLIAGTTDIDLGTVGFRTVEVDRSDGGFTLAVNGTPLFCRGACWVPPDIVTLSAPPEAVRASLERVVAAGMNMVRILGYTSYEDATFWELCDELGLLVWQDCMLASFDPPEEPAFVAGLDIELRQVLGALQGRPALAVVCGSADTYQQPAMYGLSSDRWHSPLLEETIPALVEQLLPGIPYVPSSPIGGALPFDPDQGVAAYFGVGAYRRPVSDVRVAGVRFASECLAFSIPPERATVEEAFGSAAVAGHHPTWKAAVPRDAGASWDFEDVRDEYVRQVFDIDPVGLRYVDPERALDYGRAAVAQVMTTALTEWRCRRSACAGALILNWQDLVPGAGWGLVDAVARPKSPWYGLARTLAPVALLVTDDGLSGLTLHVVNDRAAPVGGELRLTLYDLSGAAIEDASRSIEVAGRSQGSWSTASLLDGFRDLTDAYRFGPQPTDVVRVVLEVDGVLSEAFHLPGGARRPVEAGLGLGATAAWVGNQWQVTVRTGRFAQWVAIDTPDHVPADSWFHLAPGTERTVALAPRSTLPQAADPPAEAVDRPPRGRVRALNGLYPVPIVTEP
jgi:beta-mannosidase